MAFNDTLSDASPRSLKLGIYVAISIVALVLLGLLYMYFYVRDALCRLCGRKPPFAPQVYIKPQPLTAAERSRVAARVQQQQQGQREVAASTPIVAIRQSQLRRPVPGAHVAHVDAVAVPL